MKISAGTQMVMNVAESLSGFLDQLVFVGGAVTDLLMTESDPEGARPTKDVDVITEISSYVAQSSFESTLRAQGFTQDQEGPICRWTVGENWVDFMPLTANVLGFTNPWYTDAVQYASHYVLPNTQRIRLISAPYFLATKTCAFLNRGNNDFLVNSDIEDMIRVINGRPKIVDEIAQSPTNLQQYLATHWQAFLDDPDFKESIQWIWSDVSSQSRYPLILERIQRFTQEKEQHE